MKKLLLSAWLMMLSIAAMAQTLVVEGKDGSVTPYDTKQVSSVDFAVYSVKNDRDTLVQLIGERDGHVYSFKTNELSYGNADIQKILESIKLK